MDTNTTTIDFDSLYYELEKQILTLIADDEAAKQSTTVWINRPRYILEQQDENYFCWKHDFGNPANSVPVWLVNSTSHGTGVFIPRTRKGNKPSRRWKGRGRKYNRVVD